MKHFAVSALFALTALGQTPVTFPAIPMPAAVSAFGEFNQLGSPRYTMGISAFYPIVGSAGIYGSTTADILPKLATDPATGRKFYAISSSLRQGFHKDLVDTGRASFLVGADMGPSFSQSPASGINVSFSSSFVVAAVYQVTPVFSLIVPLRMLYIAGVGWNPIAEAGILINLKNLPKAK